MGVAGTGEALSFPQHFRLCGCPQIKVPSVGKQVWKRLSISDSSAGELGSKATSPELKYTFTATPCTLSFWWVNCEGTLSYASPLRMDLDPRAVPRSFFK